MSFGYNQSRKIAGGKYYWELKDWVNQLFLKYNKCLICGSKEHLEPHHIVQVKPYDKLYSDINNGAVLCKKCHRRYHELYDEVNGVTLMQFARSKFDKKGSMDYKTLLKKYKQLKKVEKYYRNETFRLREELGLTENGYFKKDDVGD